ncbi:MAG: M15 family metallopeptidase [Patescibacteria group bacterium]
MSHLNRTTTLGLVLCGVLVLVGSYAGYRLYIYTTWLEISKQEARTELASTTEALSEAQTDRVALSEALEREQIHNGELASKVNDYTSTVDTLTKLTQTDRELLQKYSRVYFLNENYIPKDLANIDPEYLYDAKKKLQVHEKVLPYLGDMLNDAENTGVPLLVVSGYRSFTAQAVLKTSYRVTYGSGSNTFSADQGYSEHQLGTTVDLTTDASGANFNSFSKTKAYTWLTEHAYQYGFILSYPPGNKYYQYEPWHWRFVGVALATKLHEDELHFYDLPQREIDSFLVSIFD